MSFIDRLLDAWHDLTPYIRDLKQLPRREAEEQLPPDFCEGRKWLIALWVFRRQLALNKAYTSLAIAALLAFIAFAIVHALSLVI